MLPASEPIPRRKLSDEVFDRLKRMIMSGEARPGQTLPSERELMDRFGVGRPAIREAMQALANMGLISISHGERARVCHLTARSITQQVDLTAQIMLATSAPWINRRTTTTAANTSPRSNHLLMRAQRSEYRQRS